MNNSDPLVSVIVPLFNREKFLPQLFDTLEKQTFSDFELILVDDGSTDNTENWLANNSLASNQSVFYIKQKNGGPYSARNTGVEKAKGKYLAFQDSDDEWPDYHLEEFVNILEKQTDIDWIFGEIQRIDHDTRQVVQESNYITPEGSTHPFIQLATELRDDGVHVITDPNAAAVAISTQVPGSTQCALIRKSVFDKITFDASYRTTYDRFYAIKCLLLGFKFAYVKRVHQIYHIHDAHISLVAGGDAEKRIKSAETLLRGYQELSPFINNKNETVSQNHKLATIYAWSLSIALQDKDQYRQAAQALKKAITLHPVTASYYKSYLACLLKWTLNSLGFLTNKDNRS